MLFCQVNQRLNQTFGYLDLARFKELPLLVCDDFHLLPSVKGGPVYSTSSSVKSVLSLDLRRRFKMTELMEVVKQQGNNSFIELLNKIQKGVLDEKVEKALLLRFVSKGTSNFLNRAVHIFAENNPVSHHNEIMSEDTDQSLVCLNTIDEVPKGC